MSRDNDTPSAHTGPDAAFTRRVLRAWVVVVLASVFLLIALTAVVEVLSPLHDDSGRIIGPADFAARGLPEDRPAPSFSLPVLGSAGRLRSATYAGRVVVLNVWASWCPPCRREAPVLESLWRRYQAMGVQFLGIDHRDNRTWATQFRRAFGITFPSGFDPKGRVAIDYGVVGIPTTFVIARGRVVFRFLGALRGPELARVLDAVLSAPSPHPSPG